MKVNLKYYLSLIVLLTALFLVAAAPLQEPGCANVVMGGVCTLNEGETLQGDLVIMGGTATMEVGSQVTGNVAILGGSLSSDGRINGDAVVIGGLAAMGENAVVEGDVVAIGGHLQRDEGATIEGDYVDMTNFFPLVVPSLIEIPKWETESPNVFPGGARGPHINVHFNPFIEILITIAKSFGWAILAVLVILFLPVNAERTAGAIVAQPIPSGGLGCATAIVAPILLVALAITICGIPLSLIGLFLLVAAWAFGLIVIGMEIGKRLGVLLKQDWALPVSAGVGTFLLTIVINSVGALVPCVGWVIPVLVGAIGLGAVLLTRFGSQTYPPTAAAMPSQTPAPISPITPSEPVIVEPVEATDEIQETGVETGGVGETQIEKPNETNEGQESD